MIEYSFNLVDFEYFLLCLVRVATFIFVAPFFNMTRSPTMSKIATAVFISIIVIQIYHPTEAMVYHTMIGYSILVLKEAIAGLLMGFALNLCTYIINFAGFVIDMDIGISMAQEFNPILNTQSTITGSLYYYGIMLLMFTSGMYQYIVKAIIESFELIPLGGEKFNPDSLISSLTMYMTDFFIIAFRIMLPIFAVIMIMNTVLGIMAKTAPQLNMFSVGMQLKILSGLFVLYLALYLLPGVADFIFVEMRRVLVSFLKGMY
ncbi:MAG: flagellar biosynthetic protein FliR [Lachnospiraceae bacterium]|nr:flagellar biosynthetic protein FliR [Lachnospiraceae bacterium]